jgi:DNA-binding transcriptional ArsR family regulator
LINSKNGVNIKNEINGGENMKNDLFEILLNPTRTRIIQILMEKEVVTSNELNEILTDIPKTTLYRHLNTLIEAEILIVVAEKKIRGTFERTFTLKMPDFDQMTDAEIPQHVYYFLMSIHTKFQKYFTKKDQDQKELIYYYNTTMMLSDVEYTNFHSELTDLLQKYHLENQKGRRPRNVSYILAPPEVEEEV